MKRCRTRSAPGDRTAPCWVQIVAAKDMTKTAEIGKRDILTAIDRATGDIGGRRALNCLFIDTRMRVECGLL
ncbi:hypothetical protein MPLSOD_120017 [Mesorhizobium sp. SOD10]|nr:hypothetical protein MPLSOD_120017 [Mesorhizobium sp. SOD10]